MERRVQKLLTRYRDLIDRELRRLHARTIVVDRLQQVALEVQINRLHLERAEVVKCLRVAPPGNAAATRLLS